MSYSVQDVLSYIPLTRPVETIKSGIPKVLPPEFWTTTEEVLGNKARLIEYQGTRRTARISPYGSPPAQVDKLSVSDKALILLHSFEEQAFRDELIVILREWDDYKPQQQFCLFEIARQGEQFRTRQENLEVAATQKTLADGVLYFDGSGNLLPTSSGDAVTTVDQGVPAINKGQLDSLLTGSFADTAFDIPGWITGKFIPRAVQQTGYMPVNAIYGANIPGYFSANTHTQLMWAYNQAYNAFYNETGQIKPGFLGFNWIPAQTAFFEDNSGTVQSIFPADQITFTPAISAATYAFYRGSKLVPTQFGPLPTGEAALRSLTNVFGRGRFAYIPQNLVATIIDVMFNIFLVRLKTQEAYYFLDTVP